MSFPRNSSPRSHYETAVMRGSWSSIVNRDRSNTITFEICLIWSVPATRWSSTTRVCSLPNWSVIGPQLVDAGQVFFWMRTSWESPRYWPKREEKSNLEIPSRCRRGTVLTMFDFCYWPDSQVAPGRFGPRSQNRGSTFLRESDRSLCLITSVAATCLTTISTLTKRFSQNNLEPLRRPRLAFISPKTCLFILTTLVSNFVRSRYTSVWAHSDRLARNRLKTIRCTRRERKFPRKPSTA